MYQRWRKLVTWEIQPPPPPKTSHLSEVSPKNCLTSMLNFTVMRMRTLHLEKHYIK